MKKMNILFLSLAVGCLLLFAGYRAWRAVQADRVPPQITVSEAVPEVSVQDGYAALLGGVTAMDDRDGNVSGTLLVEKISLLSQEGDIAVSCAAFDRAGNVAKATRNAKYTDYRSPRFNLEQPLSFAAGQTFDVLKILSATDQLDGDIQHRIRAEMVESGSISAVGTHPVRFQVSNSLGDTVSYTFPVDVYPAGTYDAKLTLTEYLIYLPVGDTFYPEAYLDSFTVLNQTSDLKNGLPSDASLQVEGAVDTQIPGAYTVSYYVSAGEENRGLVHTGYSKLIVIVEG